MQVYLNMGCKILYFQCHYYTWLLSCGCPCSQNVMKPLLKGFSTNCFQKTVFSSTLPILDFSFLSSPQLCFSFSANNITCSSEGIQRTVASSPNSTTPNVISTTTGTASLESTTSNGRQETFNTCLKSSSSSACS